MKLNKVTLLENKPSRIKVLLTMSDKRPHYKSRIQRKADLTIRTIEFVIGFLLRNELIKTYPTRSKKEKPYIITERGLEVVTYINNIIGILK